MSVLRVTAPAKINLTLEVLRRREDGYHEIASIIQTIGLFDVLMFESSDLLTFSCDIKGLSNNSNIVFKAAHLLRQVAGYSMGADIRLKKGVPVGAGLGGGSSDAASTLKALNELWCLGMTIDELSSLAIQLGSDVPFFLHGGTAMVSGIGDVIRRLPSAVPKWILLCCPDIKIPDKTKTMYSKLSTDSYTGGLITRKLESRIRNGGDTPGELMFNVFDEVAVTNFIELQEYRKKLYMLGLSEIHVAGSGPSFFVPLPSEKAGVRLKSLLGNQEDWEVFLLPIWTSSGEHELL